MTTVTKAANAHTVVATGWTNPSNAYSTTSDGAYATLVTARNATRSGDFAFPAFTTSDIPDGATIDSVVVYGTVGLTSAPTGRAVGLQARRNSTGTTLGTEAVSITALLVDVNTTATGATLTDLRTAGEFVVRARATKGNSTTACTAQIDRLYVTVTYTEAAARSGPAGTITLAPVFTMISGDTSRRRFLLEDSSGVLLMEDAFAYLQEALDLAPAAAALLLSSTAPDITIGTSTVLVPTSQPVALTGIAPDAVLSDFRVLDPAAAALALTGIAPTASLGYVLTPTAAGLALTGQTPTADVQISPVLSPTPVTVTVTGIVPVVDATAHVWLNPDAAALAVTGQTPLVYKGTSTDIVPTSHPLALTAFAPGVVQTDLVTLTPDPAQLALAFAAPVVLATDPQTLVPGPLGLTLSTAVPYVGAFLTTGGEPPYGRAASLGPRGSASEHRPSGAASHGVPHA